MKDTFKIWSMGLLVGSLLLTACKEDDEGEDTTNNSALVGSWRLTSMGVSACDDATENGSSTVECNEDFCLEMVIMANGTFVSTLKLLGSTETDNGTWNTTGDILQTCAENGQDCETGTFVVSSNTLLFTTQDDESGCTIQSVFTKIYLN